MNTIESYGRTKIVCTLGPASTDLEVLGEMIKAGMDIIRLNFSHGTHADHQGLFAAIRQVARKMGKHITILQDLQGPRIRVGELAKPVIELKKDEPLTITMEEILGDEKRISTTYTDLAKDIKQGNRILLDDGRIELKILAVKGSEVFCRVVTGGSLKAHKGINLPGASISAPALTDKDKADLELGLASDVDYVALSFVGKADDIRLLRDFIIDNGPKGKKVHIIAKIEKGEAVADIDAILAEADGVMVARGDLGVELPAEEVPMLQKMIIRKCQGSGKPVIIATQMLESMIESPRPTRAEASDVANAVLEGADAVMLSGETSVGKHPVEAVQIMDRIIRKAETQINEGMQIDKESFNAPLGDVFDAVGRAACVLAHQVSAAAIVPLTHSGRSAQIIARYRPKARIVAVTGREKIVRRLNLYWGICSIIVEQMSDFETSLKVVLEKLLQAGYVQKGDYIVVTAGIPLMQKGTTNMVKVQKVE
ncbi:MAG: pyruvate kinase [Bacteroidota bacterium]